MKIIDAHFHMFPEDEFTADELRKVGHKPGFTALQEYYREHDFAHGVIMSNLSLDPEYHRYPKEFHYCIGLDALRFAPIIDQNTIDLVDANLQQPQCCGIKLYPGYNPLSIASSDYEPVYDLARKYDKPVAIHMGQTAHSDARLKYSHPLTLDEVASTHPDVQFVMCHFGNPFLPDAAAVVEKNENVAVDLSGLLVGIKDLDSYFEEQCGYITMLRGWIAYVEDWSRFMFGTDFPAVNLSNYAEFAKRLIPERYWEDFFYNNANRIYRLGLPAL